MRHFLGILCIAIRLSLCGACSSEPEPTVKFLGDSEWENIEKSVELVHIFGYVDASLKHISPTCKQQLEERMKQRCEKPASGAHLSRCYNGDCVARSPETKCHVSFVPYVLFEKGYKPTKKP
uniref:Putative ixostatin n=1 Tax=Ixodes ricinus TaxID=34613 RepID=A0A0K8RBD1_IXORI